ncbi:MAG: hypothetical protein UT39_C0013G0004 [Candidatus Woesebacteria bacterium GW2011_GWA1_39_21]|uniref:HTH merR-type domain-containing protein n=1 Tax=Candidatus Woesebacteria bacterium GW2011_GWA1_39_21 TaxID=1618550 RepID=A0A0G0NDP0_9BACT|nr:MAG: hypothetical protein UT39_C0013G0004 [Candidatus Woesebacteria bacterium GW2011_GWA1_39_21]
MDNQGNTKRMLSIGESSEYLGVSIDTLRRWERKGRINSLRSPGGHRYFLKDDLDILFGKRYSRDEETVRRTNEQLGIVEQNPLGEVTIPNLNPMEENLTTAETNNKPLTSEEILPQASPPAVVNEPPQEPVISEFAAQTEATTSTPSVLPAETKDQAMDFQTAEATTPIQEKSDIHSETSMEYPIPIHDKTTTLQSILTPTHNESNLLSQEEIERRINTIVRSEKKKEKSNILLSIAIILILAIDAFLLFTWASTAQIQSPIP